MPIARGIGAFVGWMATSNNSLLWWCAVCWQYSPHAHHQWSTQRSISMPGAKWLDGSHYKVLRSHRDITGTPTLRVRRCGGIPAIIMVLRNSMLIAIAWSSPVSTESADKNMCSCPGTVLTIWVLREFTIVFFVVKIVRPSMYPWFA